MKTHTHWERRVQFAGYLTSQVMTNSDRLPPPPLTLAGVILGTAGRKRFTQSCSGLSILYLKSCVGLWSSTGRHNILTKVFLFFFLGLLQCIVGLSLLKRYIQQLLKTNLFIIGFFIISQCHIHETAVSQALTSFLRPCFLRGFAGLPRAHRVACQHSELVLHPGVELDYCCSQMRAPHNLRNWNKTQQNTH